ncbi:YetF domain-containing protein [Psychrobacillus soli]
MKNGVLTSVGKDRTWLRTKLAEQGYSNLQEIAYCDWSETEVFFVRDYH